MILTIGHRVWHTIEETTGGTRQVRHCNCQTAACLAAVDPGDLTDQELANFGMADYARMLKELDAD